MYVVSKKKEEISDKIYACDLRKSERYFLCNFLWPLISPCTDRPPGSVLPC